MSFVKIVLSILGVVFVCILTIARIYRTFFYKEQFRLEMYLKTEVGRLTASSLSSLTKHVIMNTAQATFNREAHTTFNRE